MSSRLRLTVAASALVATMGGWAAWAGRFWPGSGEPRTVAVDWRAFDAEIELPCVLVAGELIQVPARRPGTVVEVLAEPGERVRRGQRLAWIESEAVDDAAAAPESTAALTEIEAALEAYQRAESAQRALLTEAERRLEAAELEYSRAQQLAADGLIARNDLAAAQAARSAAAAELQQRKLESASLRRQGGALDERRKAALAAASRRAELAEADRRRRRRFAALSPADGTVKQIRAAGTRLGESPDTATVAVIEAASRPSVRAHVAAGRLSWIKPGLSAEVRLDGRPSTLSGRIVSVVRDRRGAAGVVIELDEAETARDLDVERDRACRAAIQGPAARRAPALPRAVLVQAPGGRLGVLLPATSGPRFQPVEVGAVQDGWAEIVRGLDPGAAVIADPPRDGYEAGLETSAPVSTPE